MRPIDIPQYQDEPRQLLFWSSDELVPGILIFLIGFMLSQVFLSLIIAYFVVKYFRSHKENHADGYLRHTAYWKGLLPEKGHSVVNPFRRSFKN